MLQDACTKDVFREMDGFLVLMSVLSTIHPTFSQETRADAAGPELLESTRLVFMILSEALHKHNDNTQYFKVRVHVARSARAHSLSLAWLHFTGMPLSPAHHTMNRRKLGWNHSRRRRSRSSRMHARSSRR